MDIDNLQQNMNTRVVFKEPRGMIRWLQLFFAIIAFSTVVDFNTSIGIEITCPTPKPPTPAPVSQATTIQANASSPVPPLTPQVVVASSTTAAPSPVAPLTQNQKVNPKLDIKYPFDFTNQQINNTCADYKDKLSYSHISSLSGSPQFFVMTGVLSLIYAALTLVVYLLFSSTYESIPIWPITDLSITAILCLFWLISTSSLSSGVSLLKTTVVYKNIEQTLCPALFLEQAGAACVMSESPSWKSLNVGLVSGYTSFFIWGAGMWFVFKETHFHTPRDTYGPR